MATLKLLVILLLSVAYAIWQEMFDTYHLMVAGIPFAVYIIILIAAEVIRARQNEEDSGEDERNVAPTLFAAVIFTAIGIGIMSFSSFIVDTQTDWSAGFYDLDKTQITHDITLYEGTGSWKQIEALVTERIEKPTISRAFRTELAQRGYKAIIAQGDALTDDEYKKKKETYERAVSFSNKYGIDAGEAKKALGAVKTPTPIPSPTATPTRTPTATPTRVPSPTPTQVVIAGIKECNLDGVTVLNSVALQPAIDAAEDANPKPHMFMESLYNTIDVPATANVACIVGPEGKPLFVDDKMTIEVKPAGIYTGTPRSIPFDFYDQKTLGIRRLPTGIDVSEYMFPGKENLFSFKLINTKEGFSTSGFSLVIGKK